MWGYVHYISVWLWVCLCDRHVRHEKYFLLQRTALYSDAFIIFCCFLFEFLMKRLSSVCPFEVYFGIGSPLVWLHFSLIFVILCFQWLCWNREGLSDAYSRDPRGRVRTQIISFFAYNKTNSIFNIFYVLAFKWNVGLFDVSIFKRCQEYFVRKANKDLKASTHLVVKEAEGSKYQAAKKWNIPAISKR